MARSKSASTLDRLADAAADVFTRRGYRQAQVSDIARLAGISQGTVYLYCEGKESLFWLALQRARGQRLPSVEKGPIGPRPIAETLSELIRRFDPGSYSPLLAAAAVRDAPEPDAETELRRVLEERYDHQVSVQRAVRLIERCSRDLPELYEAFYSQSRRQLFDLWATYLRSRARAGHLRTTPDAEVSARLIVETVAWFAMHRMGDPDGYLLDDALCRETVLDGLVHVFLVQCN